MTAEFACLALVTSLPVSLLGLLSGAPLDRAGASPRLRYAFAEATFWVVPAASVAVLLLALAPIGHFRSVLKATLLIPSVMGPTGAATPTPEFPVASAVLLLIALVAVWRLARLALLFRRLKRLRESADGGLGRVGAIPVQLNKDVSSPLLAGLLRPTILLPIRFANPDQSRAAALVCRHEAAHAKRRDNLRVLGEEIALAVFWFNPPLRAIRDRLSSAREEVCDLAAVSGLSLDDRRLYVRTLIQCLEARAPKFLPPA